MYGALQSVCACYGAIESIVIIIIIIIIIIRLLLFCILDSKDLEGLKLQNLKTIIAGWL